MKIELDLDFYRQFSDLEDFDFDTADEEAMKAVSEFLGHHRTDKELMDAYLGAIPVK